MGVVEHDEAGIVGQPCPVQIGRLLHVDRDRGDLDAHGAQEPVQHRAGVAGVIMPVQVHIELSRRKQVSDLARRGDRQRSLADSRQPADGNQWG